DTRSVAPRQREEVQRADDGDAVLLVDLLEVLHDGVAGRGIEARDRLVGQHEIRPLHERAGYADTLLLASREGIGARECFVRDPDAAEVLERHRDVVARWPRNEGPPERSISKAPRKGVAQHRASADEVELLKDHSDPATDPPQVGAARLGDIDTIEHDASARRFHETIDRTKQR